MSSRLRAGARTPASAAAALGLLLACVGPARAATARFEGEVVDQAGHGLAGVAVALYPDGGGVPLLATSGESGAFEFRLEEGSFNAVFSKEGYRELVHPVQDLTGTEVRSARITLELARAVELTVEAPPHARYGGSPGDERRFTTHQLDLLRLPTDRFQETLPLLPGVVRDRRGRLSFNGTRASQSLLLVNGSNATDPLTGEFAVELPLKAIDTVKVYTLPYSAEFGRVSGAVAEVTTRPGDDHWDVELGGLVPSLNFRDGGLKGIRSATPRVQVSGPLRRGRAWLSQGLSYRFVRSRARDLDEPIDEEILESFDTFTQLTAQLGEAHTLTTTVSYFPVEVENLGIDTLHPEQATPEFESQGWNLALAHRAVTSRHSLFETTVAVKSFDVSVSPKGSGPSRLGVDGLSGNYFNELDRRSLAVDISSSHSRFLRDAWGSHLLEVGADASYLEFDAVDRSSAIEIVGATGELPRSVAFEGEGTLRGSDLVAAAFVNDDWRPTGRLALTLGLRYDYDRIVADHHVSPRVAFSWSALGRGGTILKGGWGLFYDRVPLHAASFEGFQQRTETFVGGDGSADRRLRFRNRLAARGLRVPRSAMWNLELNQELAGLQLRVNYRERRGSGEPVVERLEDAPGGPLLQLASTGESLTRELDVTLRRSFGGDQELLLSWSKIRSSADLDDLDSLYGSLRDPLVLGSQRSLQPHDVPSRILLWGNVAAPWQLMVAPAIEWRRGFPYTIFAEDYRPASERNRGGRFPSFLTVDLRVTRAVTLFGRPSRIGFQAFNITDHDNPRDVRNNLASPRFGELSNSVGFSIGLSLQVSF